MKVFWKCLVLSFLGLSSQSKRERSLDHYFVANERRVVRRLDPEVEFLKACGEGNMTKVAQSSELLERLEGRCIARGLMGNRIIFCKKLLMERNMTITEEMLITAIIATSPRTLHLLLDDVFIESGQLDHSLISENIALLKSCVSAQNKEKFFLLLPFYEPSEDLVEVLLASAGTRFTDITLAVLNRFPSGVDKDKLITQCVHEAFDSRKDSSTGLLLLNYVNGRPDLLQESPSLLQENCDLESLRLAASLGATPPNLKLLKSSMLMGNFGLLELAVKSTALFTTHFTQLLDMAMVTGTLRTVIPILGKTHPMDLILDSSLNNMARNENWSGIHAILGAFPKGDRKEIVERLIKNAGKKPLANRFRASRILLQDLTTNKAINHILVFMEMSPEQTLLIRMAWSLVFDSEKSEAFVHLINRSLSI